MTVRLRRLLIAYDGGEPARAALELGIELAVATGASLGIVSVAPADRGARDDPWSETSEHAAELYEAKTRVAAAGSPRRRMSRRAPRAADCRSGGHL
jgi:nucleotide-binding universal stress UspA family protein